MSYFFTNAVLYMTASLSILIRKNAAEWLLIHLTLLVFYVSLNKRNILWWHFLLTSVVSASVIYYLFNGTNYGLIDAYTFESAMLMFAVLMPSPYKSDSIGLIFKVFSVLVCLWIGGSTCVGILGVYILGSIFYSNYKNLKILTAIVSVIGALLAFKFTDLFNDSGRFLNWAQYIDYWNTKYDMIWGTGIGSFKNIAPHAGDRVSAFLYAHNDFLELYLETGFIGLTLTLILAGWLFLYAHKKQMGHYVLMMYLFMANYFPWQIMLCKFMFVLMIWQIARKDERSLHT